MRPNNEYTTPEQRFFFPPNSEAECYESFELKNLPRVEQLPGDETWVVFTDRKGRVEQDHMLSGFMLGLESGYTIDAITTIGQRDAHQPIEPRVNLERFRHRGDLVQSAVYEPAEGDVMLMKTDFHGVMSDNLIYNLVDENNVLLVPAGEKLPYANGTIMGDKAEKVRYKPIGVIKSDLSLLTFPGEYGYHSSQQVLDWCIANANVTNGLEYAALNLDLRDNSLTGHLSTRNALAAYLRYYDQANGTTYYPTAEPRVAHQEFAGTMNEQERVRYHELSTVAYKLLRGEIRR